MPDDGRLWRPYAVNQCSLATNTKTTLSPCQKRRPTPTISAPVGVWCVPPFLTKQSTRDSFLKGDKRHKTITDLVFGYLQICFLRMNTFVFHRFLDVSSPKQPENTLRPPPPLAAWGRQESSGASLRELPDSTVIWRPGGRMRYLPAPQQVVSRWFVNRASEITRSPSINLTVRTWRPAITKNKSSTPNHLRTSTSANSLALLKLLQTTPNKMFKKKQNVFSPPPKKKQAVEPPLAWRTVWSEKTP